jgi:phage protein U
MPLAKLGDFTFEISKAIFNEIVTTSSWNWSPVNRVQKKPAQQFTGPNETTKELRGVSMPVYFGGIDQIPKLRTLADKGEPMLLVCTDAMISEILGLWCIRSINETRSLLMDQAIPQKIEYSITLVEYGEDSPFGL